MEKPQTIATGAKPWIEQTETPFIRISNLTKKFGDFIAVDNVSLDVYRQELFCLLGGSGCSIQGLAPVAIVCCFSIVTAPK